MTNEYGHFKSDNRVKLQTMLAQCCASSLKPPTLNRLFLFAAAVFVSACSQQPVVPSAGASNQPTLVSITQGGELVELERTSEHSIIEVRSAPAGSVPSSLFALRGACAVARARGEKYFASSPVPGKSATHRLTFPQAPSESQLRGPSKSVFTLAECQRLAL